MMDNALLGTLLGLLMMAVPLYIMHFFGIPLLKKAAVAFAKMVVSLCVMGLLLYYVVKWNNLVVTLLFTLLMVIAGAVSTVMHARLDIHRFLAPVGAGMLAAVVVVGTYLLFVVFGGKSVVAAPGILPVVGLLVGHMVTVNAKALTTYYMGLKHHAALYYYLLGNGAKHGEALNYLMRRSIEQCAIPGIRQMGTMVVGSAPVVMWAMMLSGLDVASAVACQLMLAIAMFAATMLSLVVTLYVSRKYLLDDYGKLR